MQEADQIPVIFLEKAGVPFTIALLSEDVDSAEKAIFMVPRIDDWLHNEDVDTRPVLLWIHPTVTGSLNWSTNNRPPPSRPAKHVLPSFEPPVRTGLVIVKGAAAGGAPALKPDAIVQKR
jgi:hypothetical protein